MAEQEYHEMVLDTIHPSGVEEWYCPTCGRRFLMQWPPAYHKVILEPGDETAIHSGGKGDLGLQDSQFELPEESSLFAGEQENLEPFLEWFEIIDFESLWNREIDREE